MRKSAFSLIEVLFAVSFLLLVGLAITSLSSASLRLTSAAEISTAAYGLNDEALALMSLERKTRAPALCPASGSFEAYIRSNGVNPAPAIAANQCAQPVTFYISCPAPPNYLSTKCTVSTNPVAIQVGRSLLQFVRKVTVAPATVDDKYGPFVVTATTSWGAAVNRQVTASQLLP